MIDYDMQKVALAKSAAFGYPEGIPDRRTERR